MFTFTIRLEGLSVAQK
jgi:hypothetical protein